MGVQGPVAALAACAHISIVYGAEPKAAPGTAAVETSAPLAVDMLPALNGLSEACAAPPAVITALLGDESTVYVPAEAVERRSTVCPGAMAATPPPAAACVRVSGAAGGAKGAVYAAAPRTTRTFET